MRRPSLWCAAIMTMAGASILTLDVPAASAATTWYVSPGGSDTATGSSASPFRTVGRAVQAAASGSTIVIRAGRYHESVQVYNKALRLQAAAGESVVFDGSTTVTGWSGSAGQWSHSWTNEPATLNDPPVIEEIPEAGYPGQIFIDGSAQREVLSRAQVANGTFFHDRVANLLWLGTNPTNRSVEVSDLSWALYFNRANGSSLTGVTVRKYATQAGDMAAVRVYSDDVTVDAVKVELNAYMGLSVMGARDKITNSTFANNGYIGVHAHESSDFRLEASTIVGNNQQGFDPAHSGSGVKVTTTAGAVMLRNYVAYNSGPGMWTDIGSSAINASNNLFRGNARSGLQIELSGQVIVAGNVALDNGEAGLWILESNDVQVWNNAANGNVREIWVEDGPRTSSTSTSAVNWDLNRVTLRNNVVGTGHTGVEALLNVDDWTSRRSAAAMAVTSDWNAMWLPQTSPTKSITRWAMWPSPPVVSATLAPHRAATGQDANSIFSAANSNPYARNAAAYDYRMPTNAARAATPPSSISSALAVAAGSAIPPGPSQVIVPTTGAPSPIARVPLPPVSTALPTDYPIPSVPTNLSAQVVAASQVTLAWNASSDDVGVTGYAVYRDGVQISQVEGTPMVISGVAPGTRSFQVQAVDADGNRSAKTPPVVVTVGDPVPTAPTNLSAQVAGSQVTLAWTLSSDDVGVVGYAVFRDGVQISQVVGTPMVISGVSAGTRSFQVQALDVGGNRSVKTPPVVVTVAQ